MEESNEKTTEGAVCPRCGLPMSTAGKRPGTVTAWIFQTSYCACKEGNATGLTPNPVNDQKASDLPLLGNRYKVLSPIGRGGVANVYKVQDSVTMNILAAKVMLTELALNDLAVKRFRKEVDVLADLSHKNLVKIHGYAMDRNGIPYLIMDYVEGPNLEDLVKVGGPLDADLKRAVNLFVQICTGLTYVHNYGIIHRDLKPSNVIVSSKPGSPIDHVTVIDFGFAKNVDGARDSRLTSTGEAFGSPCYMSPEHCLGKELDVRSDIYSFGCLMYQALCGKPPVEGENALATVAKQVQGDVVSLRRVNPNIPKNLNTVVMQCLEKEPSMRYQTVDDIELDLIRVLSGKHVVSHSKELGTDARWSSPQLFLNRWVAMSAVVLLILGSGLAGAWIASNSASKTSSVQTIQQAPQPKSWTSPVSAPTVSTPRPAPRPIFSAPTVKPQIKTTINEAPRIEKIAPVRRNTNMTSEATKDPAKKPINRMAKAKLERKQSEEAREKWLRWLEIKKLRNIN